MCTVEATFGLHHVAEISNENELLLMVISLKILLKFTKVEEPVRRKVKTSSVAESVNKGMAKRGFELLPPEVKIFPFAA